MTTITITQDAYGRDIVNINGESVTPAISEVVLEAIDRVETLQYKEAVIKTRG